MPKPQKTDIGNDEDVLDNRGTLRVLLDTVILLRWWILGVVLFGAGLGYYFGWELPEITLGRVVMVTISLSGIPVGLVIWSIIEKRLVDDRRKVDLVPDEGETDTIYIPEEEWMELEIIGGELPTRPDLIGQTVYGISMLDLDNMVAKPATDLPKSTKAPDYWELHSRAFDSINQTYRDMLVEYAQKYTRLSKDEQVIKEKAKAESTQSVAKGMEDARNADIEVERQYEDEEVAPSEQVVRQAQGQGSESDEGDDE